MTSFMNNGEGTDGVLVTTSNSDGPSDDWTFVQRDPTGVLEYDADLRISGATSIKMGSTTSSDRAYTRWGNFTPATTQKITARFYFYMSDLWEATTIFSVQGASSVRVASLAISSTGYLNVTDGPGDPHNSAAAIGYGAWYRFEVQVDLTVPSIVVKVFAGHSTTPITGLTVNATPTAAGAPIDRVVFGKYNTTASATFWMDELALVTDSVAPIGPIAGGGVAHYDITGNYPADSSTLASWTVDATASTGTTTLVQTSGPTATIVQSPTNVYTVTNPVAPGDIGLKLTATSGGSMSQNILITRGVGGTVVTDKPYRWTYQGGGPASAIGNWK